jgi:hypothetical protein
MNERKTADPQEEIFEQYYDLNSVASMTELTGSIPSLPQSEEELESYNKIQSMPIKQAPIPEPKR